MVGQRGQSTFFPFFYSGAKRSRCKTEKRYLGVRVRMPVRDLLRNIRIAKGMDPKDIQVGCVVNVDIMPLDNFDRGL